MRSSLADPMLSAFLSPSARPSLRLFIQNIGFSEGAHFPKVMRLLPDERISMSPGGSPLVGIDLGGARRTRGARRFRGWEGPELEVMSPPLERHGLALVPFTLQHIRVVEHHAVRAIGNAHRDANGPRLICSTLRTPCSCPRPIRPASRGGG